MNGAELKRAKRAVRRDLVAARDAVPADVRTGWSLIIADRVVALPELAGMPTVMLFWSFGSEVDSAPSIAALHGRGARIALPRIVDGDLEARRFVPGDRVSPTRFGAFEPIEGEVLDPGELDVIVTPGVAFDRSGGRIGYGGGFYDRLFPRTRVGAVRAGIAFDLQIVEHELPAGHFDLRVDLVVTETRTLRCARAG